MTTLLNGEKTKRKSSQQMEHNNDIKFREKTN